MPSPPWWRRPLPVAVAASTTLVVAIALFGPMGNDPPTKAEKDAWADALADPSGHGLRWYLHQYPSGAYADEAETRLEACWTQTVESLGPKRDVRHPFSVEPSATSFPSEEEARKDALARGNRDALELCRPIRRTANVLSVTPEPKTWRCRAGEQGHACGFDGETICRVRDRREREYERCGAADDA